MAAQIPGGVRRVIGNPHFWLVAVMFVLAAAFHYPQQLPLVGSHAPTSFFGLERHALERVLFLLPATYAGFVFGINAGLTALAVALALMLPRIVLVSDSPADASVETAGIILVGLLVNLWFEGYQREKQRREKVLSELRAAQRQLQSDVQTIQNRERQLAAVNLVSNTVSQSLELKDLLRRATGMVKQVMDTEIFLGFIVDECTGDLVLEASEGVSEEFAASLARMKLGEGFNGRVAESGEPMVVTDASHDPRLTRVVVGQERIQSQLIVPAKSKGKVMGTLCVATRRSREFPREQIQLLSAIGNVIGVAIENARLYQRQRRMAEALAASEKGYRELFENAHDAIFVQDLEGQIVMTNAAGLKLGGYAEEELLGKHVRGFLTPEGLEVAREVGRRLLQGEVIDQAYDQQFIKKDGSLAHVKLTTSLITSNGQPRAFQHITRDITEEKRLEENMRYYLEQVTRAQEEERKRIARELHDDTAQELVALSRELESFVSTSGRLSRHQLELVDEIQGQVDKILEGLRRFSQDLRPSVLDDLGLLPALEWLTSDVEAHFGVDVGMAVVGPERRFSPEVELLLFRIAQEALRNVWRHAEASRAWLTVEFDHSKTTLTVSDNGKGFKVPRRAGDLAEVGKLGLAGMEERARLVGGTLRLQSKPGEGAIVTVEAPI
jgi:PAS domain S-box-containing protein